MALKNINFNKTWQNFLLKTIQDPSKLSKTDSSSSRGASYKEHELLETSLSNLDYNVSDNFFTKEYKENIANVLDANNFNKKTHKEHQNVQNELDMLMSNEYEWKRRVKAHNSDFKDILELFPHVFARFCEGIELYFEPGRADLRYIQRSYYKFFYVKMTRYIQGMVDLLIEKNHLKILIIVKHLTYRDFSNILNKYICKRSIFVDLVKVITKEFHDNLFSNNKKNSQKRAKFLVNNSFVIDKTSVFYEFRRVFALYIITAVLNYIAENIFINNFDLDTMKETVRNFIFRRKSVSDREDYTWWTKDLSNSVAVILSILEQSGFFVEVVNEKKVSQNGISNRTKYILPIKIENLLIKHTQLPRVVIPGDITDADIDENLKTALFGVNIVSKSDSFKRTLSIAQRKNFGVSRTYLRILKEVLFASPYTFVGKALVDNLEKIDLPFMLSNQLADLRLEIAEICGISDLEMKVESSSNLLRVQYRDECLQRKRALSSLTLGELFDGMPLFITNTFCGRLRLYPKQLLVSRTSGSHKHILCEFTPQKVTLRGLINLFRCFYEGAQQFVDKLDELLEVKAFSKNLEMKNLFTFFHENSIDFLSLGDNFLYVSLLYAEILTVELTGKTCLMVEIDQKASGCVFLALALRNKKLAEQTNIISKTKTCPYTYCMDKFKEFYHSTFEVKDKDALDFLTSSRKLHKYALMRFCYSQTPMGRREDFIELWYLEKKQPLEDSTKSVLVSFANKYVDFIEYTFPGVTKQIVTLLKIVDIVVGETGEMSIINLNGEKLRWRRFRHKSITRKCFNPVTKKSLSYRVETTVIESGNEKDDIQDHKTKFLSYLIHSLDAAVMHRFVTTMYDQDDYIINHLHDCVFVHPNYVDTFYDKVDTLFKSRELYDIIINSVFDQAKQKLSEDSTRKVEKLIKEFIDQCDDFADDLVKGESRNLYQPKN